MRATKPPIVNAFANDPGTQADPDLFSEPVFMDTGYTAPAGIPEIPLLGDFNWFFFQMMNAFRYQCQRGISDWDAAETDYGTFDVVRGTDGKVYQLIGTATLATTPQSDAGNWYLWHRPPRPMTGETAVNEIAAWYNAKGFRITGKDHYGFDAGRLLDLREDWVDAAAANKSNSGSGAWFGRWNYGIDNSGGIAGLISLPGPYVTDLSTRPWGPLVTVNAFGQSVDAVSMVETAKPIIKMSQAALVFEVGFSINGASGPQTHSGFAFGLADGTLVANRTLASSLPTAYGAWLEMAPAGATWGAISKPSGGGGSGTNTGVSIARDQPHRYRCVIAGTSDSDDSTAKVIHMIDGVIKATHAVSLNNQMLSPFAWAFGNQGEVCALALGPMRCQVRLELGDILI